jgi:hypothetical protein
MLQGGAFAWSGLLEGVAKRVPKSSKGLDFEFVSTAGRAVWEGGPDPLPEKGVVSLGKKPQLEWWNEVAKGKAMVCGFPIFPEPPLMDSWVLVGHGSLLHVSPSFCSYADAQHTMLYALVYHLSMCKFTLDLLTQSDGTVYSNGTKPILEIKLNG